MADSSASRDKRTICTSDPNPALQQLDPSTAFLFAPRTITLLVTGLVLIAHFAHVWAPDDAIAHTEDNLKRGLWAAVFVYLVYSVTHGPTTSMVRPHPAAWRLVHGVLVLYTLMLVWLIFQDVSQARAFMKHLHHNLGTEVQYRTYSADCRLWLPSSGVNWPAIRSTLFDEFVLAHLLGWWGKALVIRNKLILWVISIGFELMEVTFRHMLPNFNECWWDSWVLDVAMCNLAGITLGMATVRYFECQYTRYNWQGLSQCKGLKAKAKRSLAQLLPYTWDNFNWMAFSSPLRFLQCMFVVVFFLAFELNAFFLKYALWIPPANPLNTYRLIIWFLLGLPAVREYYEFIEGRSLELGLFPKLGAFAWMAIAITCLETLISIKFGRGLYPNPWPRPVVLTWQVVGVAAAVVLLSWQLLLVAKGREGQVTGAGGRGRVGGEGGAVSGQEGAGSGSGVSKKSD